MLYHAARKILITSSITAQRVVAPSSAFAAIISRRHLGFWSKAKTFWNTMLGVEDDPRAEREWQDLSRALVALNHRRLRLENAERDPNELIDTAYQGLEKKFLELSNLGLRHELHDALTPMLLEILETFQNVQGRLGSPQSIERDSLHHQILLKEYAETLRQLADQQDQTETEYLNRPSPIAYLQRKSSALRLLLEHYGYLDRSQEAAVSYTNDTVVAAESTKTNDDTFGYDESLDNKDVSDAMRHFQAINLVHSALIRQQLGHSVLSLKSTLPGAGRGVFVDGTAAAGSLVAFTPGEVWPKEHLLKMSPALKKHFSDDENDQLSLRSDEVLIDSRRSPYTVLTDDGSNPWALGHIVNHPPPNAMPNCRVVMINFTESMELKRAGLMRFVPNTYARQPMLLGTKAFERDRIVMLGLGLQAVRDVSNEELFYDYRLSPSKAGHPSWYQEIDSEEAAQRYQDEQTLENR